MRETTVGVPAGAHNVCRSVPPQRRHCGITVVLQRCRTVSTRSSKLSLSRGPRGPPLVSHPGLPGLSDHLGNGTPGMVRCDGLAPSNVVDHLAQERQVDLGDASVTSLKVRF